MEPTKTQNRKKIWIWIAIYASLCLAILFIVNTDKINAWLGRVVDILSPAIIGLVLSYLINPFFRFFERRVL